MTTSTPAPPIVHTQRAVVREAVSEELKALGFPTVLAPTERDDCIEALIKSPDSFLIIDWALGSPHVNAVLSSIKTHFLIETRPIFLVIDDLEDDVVATGAEFGVSQIHAGPLERASIRECLAALVQEASLDKPVREALVQVADARARKDSSLATSLLAELRIKYPSDERVAFELAESLIGEGDWTDAMAIVEPITQSGPPNIRALHILGRCQLALGKPQAAIASLNKATLINPHNVDRLVDLGNAFFKDHQIENAMQHFEAAGKLEPKSKGATVGKSKCLLMTGEVNEALALMKSVSGPREMASIFNTAAVLAMQVGNFEKGMSLYRSAIGALGKDDRVASRLYFNLGLGYRRWSKPEKALAAFARSLDLDPQFEKAARHMKLAAAAAGVAVPASGALPAESIVGEEFSEENLGARSSSPLPGLDKEADFSHPSNEIVFEDD